MTRQRSDLKVRPAPLLLWKEVKSLREEQQVSVLEESLRDDLRTSFRYVTQTKQHNRTNWTAESLRVL